MTVGNNLHNYCIRNDTECISKGEKQCRTNAKIRLKKLRAMHKDFCYQNKTFEIVVYGSVWSVC